MSWHILLSSPPSASCHAPPTLALGTTTTGPPHSYVDKAVLAGAPLYPDQFFPDASAGSPLEALAGSVPAAMGASVLDSIMSFKARNSLRSPCEQLQRSQALKAAAAAGAAAGGPTPAALQQGASGNRPPAAFFFRDPSMRLAYLGPSGSAQGPLQQQTLVEPAPAEAEGTGAPFVLSVRMHAGPQTVLRMHAVLGDCLWHASSQACNIMTGRSFWS